MRQVYCPIDTSLDFTQVGDLGLSTKKAERIEVVVREEAGARKLINELKPAKLVVPEVYMRPPANAPHRTDLTLDLVWG
ncbi:Integrator complex subunit 9 [Portunus trituberculatus]|uniref:Integrator complex subunit 9 n=1 Tax=Portunus trituberculatus TaxID=210409 RepID=A0A5B7ISA4_PORTR|nr:Integrator complex subunit 9 [Portunus trituberculatus]